MSKCVAGKQHHRHRDCVGDPKRGPDVLHEHERHHDGYRRGEDEQEDGGRAQPVLRLESPSARSSRTPSSVRHASCRDRLASTPTRLRKAGALTIAALASSTVPACCTSAMVRRSAGRSARLPMKYMIASMRPHARLQPITPTSIVRTSDRPLHRTQSAGKSQRHDQSEKHFGDALDGFEHLSGGYCTVQRTMATPPAGRVAIRRSRADHHHCRGSDLPSRSHLTSVGEATVATVRHAGVNLLPPGYHQSDADS